MRSTLLFTAMLVASVAATTACTVVSSTTTKDAGCPTTSSRACDEIAGDAGSQTARDATADGAAIAQDASMADAQGTSPDASDDAGANAPASIITGAGKVFITVGATSALVALTTTLVVPPSPPPSGTLFLWPGIEPGTTGAHYQPIGNGVLQPVLTWGPSCAPGMQPGLYSTWWISAQYVNTLGSNPGFMGCYGGPIMSVGVGDSLSISMTLSGTVWTQKVTDAKSGQFVSFDEDLLGQTQNNALFLNEAYSSAPVSDVVYTNTSLTFATPDAADCAVLQRGTNDFVSIPRASADGLTCFVSRMVLRSQ